MNSIAFYIFAGIAVLASIGVVSQKNPMHSVMLLIVSSARWPGSTCCSTRRSPR